MPILLSTVGLSDGKNGIIDIVFILIRLRLFSVKRELWFCCTFCCQSTEFWQLKIAIKSVQSMTWSNEQKYLRYLSIWMKSYIWKFEINADWWLISNASSESDSFCLYLPLSSFIFFYECCKIIIQNIPAKRVWSKENQSILFAYTFALKFFLYLKQYKAHICFHLNLCTRRSKVLIIWY